MTSLPKTFRSSFWETDFVSQVGFETLVAHMKEGQKSCKWLEDFLKQRAKAEEDYSKTLLKISKVDRGSSESSTLRKALDDFRAEAETEANLHASLAQKIMEEASKLTDFREKQKDERKRNEDSVHRSHKHKADLYRKLQTNKSSYEAKCKQAEKSESEAEKMKFGNKARDREKASKAATQARANAMKADDDYKASVVALEAARKTWVNDHTEACEAFQKMEEERIQFVRNSVWVFANHASDLCCRLDESRERIRCVTERCDETADIKEFVSQKSVCINPLLAIEYVPYGASEPVAQHSHPHQDVGHHQNLANGHHHIYEMDRRSSSISISGSGLPTYTVLYDYKPISPDELELTLGDTLQELNSPSEDGWVYCLNIRTQMSGLVPRNYVEVA